MSNVSRMHKCDVCGRVERWSDLWSRYSSVLHDDTCPNDMPEACSEKCKIKMLEKLDSGEWKLPKLSRVHAYGCDVKESKKGY